MDSSAGSDSGDIVLGPVDSHVFEDAGDDWVSLMLSDVDFSVEAESSASLGSLGGFPLPELDDFDFTHLDGSTSSFLPSAAGNGFDGIVCSFDGRKLDTTIEQACSPEYVQVYNQSTMGHGFSVQGHYPDGSLCHHTLPTLQLATCGSDSALLQSRMASDIKLTLDGCLPPATQNDSSAGSQSPESGVSHGSSEYPDPIANSAILDSGSEDDNLLFLISDICAHGTSSMELQEVSSIPNQNSEVCLATEENRTDANGAGCGQLPCGSDSSANDLACSKMSRKRKAVDRKSRSSTPANAAIDHAEDAIKEDESKEEDDEKKQAKLMRNRESAQLSRQRKKLYVDELEEKIKTMASTIAELNNTVNLISAENINLRRQLSYFGPPPGQPGGVPGAVPWVGAYPCSPMVGGRFMVPGSQVPLVPIPKWRSPQSASKKTTKSKTHAEEKSSKRTKKLASVAVLGIFFFSFLLLPSNLNFLAFTPSLNTESNTWPAGPWYSYPSSTVIKSGGRVLMGLEEEGNTLQREPHTKWIALDDSGGSAGGRDPQTRMSPERWQALSSGSMDRSAHEKNASVSLAATLFVPKNDRLVKIDGNLVIYSVLAGEKASRDSLSRTDDLKSKRSMGHTPFDKGLALDANLKALAVKAAPEEKGALVELQKVLAGSSHYDVEGGGVQSVREDGSLQQWFMEGLAGPVFSSGMCTEVFQFETSRVASASSSTSASHSRETVDFAQNSSQVLSGHGPRKVGRSAVQYAVPLPPIGHKVSFNGTSKGNSTVGSNDRFQSGTKFEEHKVSSSSIVVSVLTGAELGDHAKLSRGSKGLSQIFVVVLIDSVKYVTYSCVLPSSGSSPRYEVVVA